MPKNHDAIRNVVEVLAVIIFYLAVIEVLAIFYILRFVWQLLTLSVAYTNSKKHKSSKGAFATGVFLRVAQGLMKK